MKPVYDSPEEDVYPDQNSPDSNTLKAENDKRDIDNPKLNRDNNNPHDKDRDFDDEDEEEDNDDFLDDGFEDDDDSLTDDEEYDDDPQETKRNQKRTGTDTNP